MSKIWILEKLLPPKNKAFFEDFEKAAATCHEMAVFFEKVVENGVITEEVIVEAKHMKHKGSDIERATMHRLNDTFITPFDREDIQILACKLGKITKRLVQICLNLRVYRLESLTEPIHHQSKNILRATEELMRGISLLSTISKTREITESRSRMKEIEGYGDEIHYRAMDELYSGKYEALDVIKLRDIYKDLENVLDNCFAVSDEILNVALKNN